MFSTMQSLCRSMSQNLLRDSRGFSTSTLAREGSQPFRLPPARVRALIALYHRSSSFITPDQLSSRIDQAFTWTPYKSDVISQHSSYQALQLYLQRSRAGNKKDAPYYRDVQLSYEQLTWSDKRGVRQARVKAALWGTQVGGRPALDTVLETSTTNKKASDLLDQTST